MATFLDLCRLRYSCRDYKSDPVDRDTIVEVMEAVRLAPSAVNRQPWQFVVIDEAAVLEPMKAVYRKEGFKNAPVMVVCLGEHNNAWHRPTDGKDHTDIDVAIAVEHLCLAAAEKGLGSCWICSFDVDLTRRLLNLPDDLEPIALTPLGWPAVEALPDKKRKPLDQILKWQKF